MILVTVTFEPPRGKSRELGSLEISNDLSHPLRPEFGNYRAVAFEPGGNGIAEARVIDHQRDRAVWALIAQAANAIYAQMEKDGTASLPFDGWNPT